MTPDEILAEQHSKHYITKPHPSDASAVIYHSKLKPGVKCMTAGKMLSHVTKQLARQQAPALTVAVVNETASTKAGATTSKKDGKQ